MPPFKCVNDMSQFTVERKADIPVVVTGKWAAVMTGKEGWDQVRSKSPEHTVTGEKKDACNEQEAGDDFSHESCRSCAGQRDRGAVVNAGSPGAP